MTPQELAKLVHSHAWLSLALVVIPLLDKTIAAGEWPASLVASVKVRLLLIAFGGGAVGLLQAHQSGASWEDAALSSALVVVFSLLKNGQSLFASAPPPAPPALPAPVEIAVPEPRASEPTVPDRLA